MKFSQATLTMKTVGAVRSVAPIQITWEGDETYDIAGQPTRSGPGGPLVPAGNPFQLEGFVHRPNRTSATLTFVADAEAWHPNFDTRTVILLPMNVRNVGFRNVTINLTCNHVLAIAAPPEPREGARGGAQDQEPRPSDAT